MDQYTLNELKNYKWKCGKWTMLWCNFIETFKLEKSFSRDDRPWCLETLLPLVLSFGRALNNKMGKGRGGKLHLNNHRAI